MVNSIQTFDLTKIYDLKGKKKRITALNNVNLSIKEGEIFGLLGPNGAGKTTLISILTTLTQPTSGFATIAGYNVLKNPKKVKSKVSLMLGRKMLYNRMTGYSNLKFCCKVYNIPNYKEKINSIAEEFELKKWLGQYVSKYSSGMKSKLAFCKTLLPDREILLLDEPTIGLDVKSTNFIVKKLKNLKKTILLTSHDMNVVEKVCNRVAFINNGNILKIGTKDDLINLIEREVEIKVEIIENKNQLKSELKPQAFINDIFNENNGLIISLKDRRHHGKLFSILSRYKVLKIKEQELSLEDLFLKLIYN